MRSPSGAFTFTDLRNQFVHDGFDVFEVRNLEVHEATLTARAVAERVLLAELNLNAPLAHIGTTSGPL
jgi:hypothetical protein